MDNLAGERSLSTEELSDLRKKTEAVSELLRRQLASHLETIRPLLAPQRVLGKHVRAGQRSEVRGADQAFEELKERYARVASRPFGLPKELLEHPISIEGKLMLYPWEYTHELEEGHSITMTSPVCWVLAYSSGYTPSQLRKAFASRETRRTEDVRQFVASAVALEILIEKQPEIVSLLRDLRYEVRPETCDGMGDLPVVAIQSCLSSFRPSDEVIQTATRFSGVPAFIELIDVEAVRSLQDPLKERIEEILGDVPA
jgi:hypothetical protein